MNPMPKKWVYHRFCVEAALALNQTAVGYVHRALHGHRFEVTLVMLHYVNAVDTIDDRLAKLEAAATAIRQQLHLNCLNAVPDLQCPTVERLVIWIRQQLAQQGVYVNQIAIQDTTSTGVILGQEGQI